MNTSNKIRVFVCDDMPEIVKYFQLMLEHESDIEFVGSAYSSQEAFKLIEESAPHIVLMDIQMETAEAGIELTQKLHDSYPAIKVIVITIHQKDDLIFKAYAAGAIDFISKTASVTEIVNSIHEVYNNTVSLRPEITKTILNEFSRLKQQESSFLFMFNLIRTLSNAEIDVLLAISEGKTRTSIARERYVELTTINKQITSILKKTQYRSIKSLLRDLSQNGILENLQKIVK